MNTNSVKLYLDDMTTPVAQTTPLKESDESRVFTYIGKSKASFTESIIKATNGLTDKNKNFWYKGLLDNIQIYNSVIISNPDTSSNLKAIGGDSQVDLTWSAVTDATSYTIKRSTTAGGPYTTIKTGVTGTIYTDTDVTNGTTYYYVVTAIVNGGEG
jgi:fibronectin type 3 domain-containing protein